MSESKYDLMMRVLLLLLIFEAFCLGLIRFIHNKKTKFSAKLLMSDGYDLLGPQQDGFKSGFVTILGNPNVGKSSLLNTMLFTYPIVYPFVILTV